MQCCSYLRHLILCYDVTFRWRSRRGGFSIGKPKSKNLFELVESSPLSSTTGATGFRQLNEAPDYINGTAEVAALEKPKQEEDDVKDDDEEGRIDEEMSKFDYTRGKILYNVQYLCSI